jgi:type VI protein secretion system component Hcp
MSATTTDAKAIRSTSQILIEATGVPGTSKRDKKEKCFEARTYTCGNSRPPNHGMNSSSSESVSAPQSEEVTVTRRPDSASAVLKRLSIIGKKIDKVVVEAYAAATMKEPAYRVTYTDVFLTRYALEISREGDLVETLACAFGTEQWEYVNEKDTISGGGYDWIKNKDLSK